MFKTLCVVLTTAMLGADLAAQSNSRGPGYNGGLYEISDAHYWGRRGAAHPNGEVGLSFENGLCNPGSIPIEWRSAGTSGSAQMLEDHPKFSFLVAKLDGDRLVQISDWSYCKHAFLSTNNNACGSCQQPPAGGAQLGVGCSDIYSYANNGSRTWLGPPEEINPWLGTWNHVGSYFDAGDPAVGGAASSDGIRSQWYTGSDLVENRVTVQESDLGTALVSGLFFQIQVLHEGEPVANRDNNIMSRPFGMSYLAGNWSSSTQGSPTYGSILTRWPGATITAGQNGNDDGRFFVAVKVSGPVGGFWHYEYAVHNVDNDRGGATFRVPLCADARVQNVFSRDIDKNPLNDWVMTRVGDEMVFTAPASNPQNWNMLFNFAFDCDVAPAAGVVTIDQARIGPGALSLTVPTTVPSFLPGIYVSGGCGTPSALLLPVDLPTTGNTNFGLQIESDPFLPLVVFFSLPGTDFAWSQQCHILIDLNAYNTFPITSTDPSGVALIPTGVDATWPDITFQAATLIPNGPILGMAGLSNGLTVRYNGAPCQ